LARSLGHGRPHRGLGHRRRVGPPAAPFHEGELEAQHRDAALGEAGCDLRHERMLHAGTGAVREHIGGQRRRGRIEQCRDAGVVRQRHAQGLGVHASPAGSPARSVK
jgi:hypothetical protein